MANIPLLVTSENAINFLGMEGACVLSTSHMIGYLLGNVADSLSHGLAYRPLSSALPATRR